MSLAKAHILFIRNGTFMSMNDINVGKYQILSREFTGDIFEKVFKDEFRFFKIKSFNFFGMKLSKLAVKFNLISNFLFIFFVIGISLKRHFRKSKYTHIITYDPFAAGLLGLLIARITGAMLICEVNGNYAAKKTWVSNNRDWLGYLKFFYCRIITPFVLNRCYAIKLLYEGQLDLFNFKVKNGNIHIFHEYTPVLTQAKEIKDGDYFLFLGSPWNIKGVDVLISAYRLVADEDSQYKLKIVGWFPEPELTFLRSLIGADDRIVISSPVMYDQAMELIAGCHALILPSRSEGMGRVLLEAMAYRKPVIASNVDGIPTYVFHNITGLLFPSEDVIELANCISKIANNKLFAAQIAENGYQYVREHLSEENYYSNYKKILLSR